MLFLVNVQILTIKKYFPKTTVLTASQAADGGKHCYIENSISTRSTIMVSLKLRLRHVF